MSRKRTAIDFEKALTDLEAFETIRRKSYAAKLNMQMLSAMHTQSGAEQEEKYLAGLFSSSKGRKAQAEIRMITSLITGAIPANAVHSVDLDGEDGLVNVFRELLAEKGALDRPVSTTQHGDVLGGLVYFLNEPGKDWPLWLLAAVSTVVVWRTKTHLLILLAVGAALGAIGWI